MSSINLGSFGYPDIDVPAPINKSGEISEIEDYFKKYFEDKGLEIDFTAFIGSTAFRGYMNEFGEMDQGIQIKEDVDVNYGVNALPEYKKELKVRYETEIPMLYDIQSFDRKRIKLVRNNKLKIKKFTTAKELVTSFVDLVNEICDAYSFVLIKKSEVATQLDEFGTTVSYGLDLRPLFKYESSLPHIDILRTMIHQRAYSNQNEYGNSVDVTYYIDPVSASLYRRFSAHYKNKFIIGIGTNDLRYITYQSLVSGTILVKFLPIDQFNVNKYIQYRIVGVPVLYHIFQRYAAIGNYFLDSVHAALVKNIHLQQRIRSLRLTFGNIARGTQSNTTTIRQTFANSMTITGVMALIEAKTKQMAKGGHIRITFKPLEEPNVYDFVSFLFYIYIFSLRGHVELDLLDIYRHLASVYANWTFQGTFDDQLGYAYFGLAFSTDIQHLLNRVYNYVTNIGDDSYDVQGFQSNLFFRESCKAIFVRRYQSWAEVDAHIRAFPNIFANAPVGAGAQTIAWYQQIFEIVNLYIGNIVDEASWLIWELYRNYEALVDSPMCGNRNFSQTLLPYDYLVLTFEVAAMSNLCARLICTNKDEILYANYIHLFRQWEVYEDDLEELVLDYECLVTMANFVHGDLFLPRVIYSPQKLITLAFSRSKSKFITYIRDMLIEKYNTVTNIDLLQMLALVPQIKRAPKQDAINYILNNQDVVGYTTSVYYGIASIEHLAGVLEIVSVMQKIPSLVVSSRELFQRRGTQQFVDLINNIVRGGGTVRFNVPVQVTHEKVDKLVNITDIIGYDNSNETNLISQKEVKFQYHDTTQDYAFNVTRNVKFEHYAVSSHFLYDSVTTDDLGIIIGTFSFEFDAVYYEYIDSDKVYIDFLYRVDESNNVVRDILKLV